jgi:N-acetylmuramoyl-L-alanine amidase/putative methionine-R-sulfoxide reductase with GAF domain
MSATPSNAGAGWSTPPLTGPSSTDLAESTGQETGQDALQALLAFACMHEQAAKRRTPESRRVLISKDEEFALDEVLRLVAARAVSITGADGVAIALADETAIVCRASLGSIAPPPGVRLDPNSGFSGACLRGGETVRCDDSETDTRVNAQACRDLGTRSMVAVPLSAKGRVVGLIEAFCNEPFGFNESDVRSLKLLGELILAAVRPEVEDQLAQMAERVLPVARPASAQTQPLAASQVSEPESAKARDVANLTTTPGPQVAEAAISKLADDQRASELPQAATASAEPAPALEQAEPESASIIAWQAKVAVEENPSPSRATTPAATLTIPEKAETQSVVVASSQAKNIIDEKFTPAPKFEKSEAPKLITIPDLPKPKLNLRAAPLEAPGSIAKERKLPGILLTAALVVVALGLGWAVVWKARHVEQTIRADTKSPVLSVKATTSQVAEPDLTSAPEAKPTATPRITGVRHWSAVGSSTVVVDLEDQVQYEAHSIDNPARIYFDLHDTKMPAGLLNQSIAVDDGFIKKIRMAQPTGGITRVVLETKGNVDYSVKLDPDPYRLTIEVRNAVTASNLNKPSPVIAISPNKKPVSAPSVTSVQLRIVLDAGHGGWDLGTVGKKGLLEKDLTLDIVQKLGQMLDEKLGADVIYTRQDDSYLPLEKRAEIANVARADLFLSVHANYSDLATARGVETYYTNTYSSVRARSADDLPALKEVNWTGVNIREKVTGSRRFASDVQQALFGGLAVQNPDVRNRGVKEAQYVVLTGTQMPAVLAEVSFVSSPADESKLQSSEYRQHIAEALLKGITRYRDDTKATKMASAKD